MVGALRIAGMISLALATAAFAHDGMVALANDTELAQASFASLAAALLPEGTATAVTQSGWFSGLPAALSLAVFGVAAALIADLLARRRGSGARPGR